RDDEAGIGSRTEDRGSDVVGNDSFRDLKVWQLAMNLVVGISRGSLAELETQPMIANRLGYVSPFELERLLEQVEVIGKMLRGLQRGLEKRIGTVAPSILDPRSSPRLHHA
ncbi:MAG TPA: four helix bundle protein, partial [Casimicrobiaceae bacterium]|nr:four helix bundle protein [Casimicrobiaceae bacterium]